VTPLLVLSLLTLLTLLLLDAAAVLMTPLVLQHQRLAPLTTTVRLTHTSPTERSQAATRRAAAYSVMHQLFPAAAAAAAPAAAV
jgi:hypothetical protein